MVLFNPFRRLKSLWCAVFRIWEINHRGTDTGYSQINLRFTAHGFFNVWYLWTHFIAHLSLLYWTPFHYYFIHFSFTYLTGGAWAYVLYASAGWPGSACPCLALATWRVYVGARSRRFPVAARNHRWAPGCADRRSCRSPSELDLIMGRVRVK